jgi:hypothetical protein
VLMTRAQEAGRKGGKAWVKKIGTTGIAERVAKMIDARNKKAVKNHSYVTRWLERDKGRAGETRVLSRREFDALP